MTDIFWVRSVDALESMCEHLQQQTQIAVDTEFMRRRSFYPEAALFQFASAAQIYLVDPLEIDDWSSLRALFANPQIDKVMHACWEDLEVFQHVLGDTPVRVLDTQLALAFLNLGWNMGYHRMVSSLLEIDLPKDSTLSDWLKRPLSAKQQHYAREDVEYLLNCFERLKQQLHEAGKWAYFVEHCEEIRSRFQATLDEWNYYKKVKRCAQLTPREQTIFRGLSAWRERQAKHENKPRGWVVDDKLLLSLAEANELNRADFDARFIAGESSLKRYADALFECLQTLYAEPEMAEEELLSPHVRFPRRHPLLKWRELINGLSQRLNIEAPLLLSKDEFFSCVREQPAGHYQLQIPDSWPQWKKQQVGEPLQQWFAAQTSQKTQKNTPDCVNE